MKFTLLNLPTGEPLYVVQEEIISFNTVPNQPDENSNIRLKGGHSIIVKQTVEQLKAILEVKEVTAKPKLGPIDWGNAKTK